ncbi:hypothetical protein GCM10023170_051030 [Phytohabitans houttuyneae]|uniref:Uncharacterized protein n=1 Tax=Phytohabitans houttuyneae TaxID=1076126 RepID=A0A6V8KRD6_9ACTN|nr:hypothetical protein Phou_093680 [Phytohabitans houttuyneae]
MLDAGGPWREGRPCRGNQSPHLRPAHWKPEITLAGRSTHMVAVTGASIPAGDGVGVTTDLDACPGD